MIVRAGTFSVLLPRRQLVAAIGLGLLAGLAVIVSTVTGAAHLSPAEAVAALFGHGRRGAVLIVQDLRLPRIVAGLVAGAALGLAGCLTQTLARNRLATPELLGVNDGAMGVMMASTLGTSTAALGAWWAGPLGAMLAGGLIVLAAGGLGTRGYRVLVVGLAMSTLFGALTDLLLARADLTTAAAVHNWTIGSLVGRGYAVTVPAAVGLAVLLPVALLAGRSLNVLRMDEDVAATLGVDLRRVRLLVLAVAVLLAGLAVGVAGPVFFLAMAAPILAGRLTGPARVPLVASALVGAVLVVGADTLARTVAAPVEIPVGVITSVLGGPFLLWVLLSDRRM